MKEKESRRPARRARLYRLSVVAAIIAWVAGAARANILEAGREDVPALERRAATHMAHGEPQQALEANDEIIRRLSARERLDDDERVTLVKAYNNAGYISMFHSNDYAAALRRLLSARELCREDSLGAAITLNFGNIYSFYAFCFPTAENQRLTRKFMGEAFDLGVRSGRPKVAESAYIYFQDRCLSPDSQDLAARRRSVALLDSMYAALRTAGGRADVDLLKTLRLAAGGDYASAAALLRARMPASTDPYAFSDRVQAVNLWRLARIWQLAGRYDSVVLCARRLEMAAQAGGFPDLEADADRTLADAYRHLGRPDSADACRLRFFELRDSLLVSRRLGEVESGYLTHELDGATAEAARLRYHRRVQWIIIGVVSLAALVVTVFVLLLRRKNRELSDRNEKLFTSYQQSLAAKKDAETPRRQSVPDAQADEIIGAVERNLTEEGGMTAPDYTLEKLAAACGFPSRQVSAAVNDHYGATFSALLQERRCRLACLRMNDDALSGRYTVEAFGAGVGFRSRTAFIRAFKNVVGMTPSEYLRIARQRRSGT